MIVLQLNQKIVPSDMFKPRTRKILRSILLQFFIGGVVLSLVLYKNNQGQSWSNIIAIFCFQGLLWTSLAHVNGGIADWLERAFPWTVKPLKTLVILAFASITATIITAVTIGTLYGLIWYKVNLSRALTFAGIGFLTQVIAITIIVSLILYSRGFFLSWRETALEAERLKRENLASKYEVLKNQVNPHFLFNSLNVLSSLVYKDADLSAKFIQQLATVYRYVLDTREQEVVTLQKEKEALEAFIFLLQIRFGENLKVNMDIPEISNAYLPPLSLQLLVENTVKHNIISKKNPLEVKIYCEDAQRIVIQNNLQIKTQDQESSGIGLENIESRYKILSNQNIEILSGDHFFTVKIPILWLEA